MAVQKDLNGQIAIKEETFSTEKTKYTAGAYGITLNEKAMTKISGLINENKDTEIRKFIAANMKIKEKEVKAGSEGVQFQTDLEALVNHIRTVI